MRSLIEIARLEEARLARGIAAVSDEAVEVGGGWMCASGPGAWSNYACGLGMRGPVPGAALDRLIAFYVDRGLEPKIEVCTFAHASLIDGLAARGFRLVEFGHTLAREPTPGEELRAALPLGRPAGLELSLLEPGDDDAVEAFIDVADSGFRPPGAPVSDSTRRSALRSIRHPDCDHFAARLDGALVGGGGMDTVGQITSLFGTSVLPGARRRGVQQALIARRLERAWERGASLAVIHSEPGIPTARNAQRLGFQLAYARAVMARPGPGLSPSG